MAKQIKLNYKGKDYVLEYSRKTVSIMEQAGLSIQDITGKMATNLPLMFEAAFIMHHRSLNSETKNEIYDLMKNKEQLFTTLIEMVSEVYNSLYAENEDDSKNLNWEIVE